MVGFSDVVEGGGKRGVGSEVVNGRNQGSQQSNQWKERKKERKQENKESVFSDLY